MSATNELHQISDELLSAVMRWDPFLASAVGMDEAAAFVPDHSPEATHEQSSTFVRLQERLAVIDLEALQFQDRLTWEMANWQTRLWPDILESRREEYTVTRYKAWSLPTAITSVMPKTVISSEAGAQAFLERCSKLPAALDEARAGLERGRAVGRVPVAPLVQGVIDLIDGLLEAGGPERTLTKIAIVDGLRLPAGWQEHREQILADELRPALEEYRHALHTQVLGAARPDEKPGLCWIDGGEAAYRASAAEHTTTSLSPQEIHKLGLETVARLADEGRSLASDVFGTSDLGATIERLRNDPELRFTNSEEIHRAAQAAFERGQNVIGEFINVLPQTRCEVRPMPELEASQMMQAYYRPGDVTSDRPGIYWVNTNLDRAPTRYEIETLTAHESVPGHHVQWSLAREISNVPYRNLMPTTAFIEGWALYCERQAEGLGLFTDQLSSLGMWSSQSWRAARLVVDTGIHAKGWSRQRAIEYMLENTATSRANAEGEVDRYIGNPGQSLAYMTGLLALQDLRAEAEARLGKQFEAKEFHDRLLANGSPALDLLPLIIEQWEKDLSIGTSQK